MELSNRVNAMGHSPESPCFNKYAIEAEANGKKVYHLNIGQLMWRRRHALWKQ